MQGVNIRTSGLAIASFICGVVGVLPFYLLGFLPVCLPVAIPALVLGVLSLFLVRRKKEVLKGKGFAIAGIILSLVSIVFNSYAVLGLFCSLPCDPTEVLTDGRLADLPASAGNVRAAGYSHGFTAEHYLMFQATPEDIQKFIDESESIKNQEPTVFNSDHMHVPYPERDDFDDQQEYSEYWHNHSLFRRDPMWPDWYDPTVRGKGRLYRIPSVKMFNDGTVIVDDETNTVYIEVIWS